MRISNILSLLLVYAFVITACVKDELAVGELEDGTIKAHPEKIDPEDDRKHLRREIHLDVDSMMKASPYPYFSHELCYYDTLDIKIGAMPEGFKVVGFVKLSAPHKPPSKERHNIITEWWGKLIISESSLVGEMAIPIHIDFDKCD